MSSQQVNTNSCDLWFFVCLYVLCSLCLSLLWSHVGCSFPLHLFFSFALYYINMYIYIYAIIYVRVLMPNHRVTCLRGVMRCLSTLMMRWLATFYLKKPIISLDIETFMIIHHRYCVLCIIYTPLKQFLCIYMVDVDIIWTPTLCTHTLTFVYLSL